jgi:ribosomal protein L40E
MSERRCPSCGALVTADAEWCGQCFASLREPTTAGRTPGSGSATTPALRLGRDAGDGPASAWRCPTCDAENGLDANRCRICGTSFSRLFEDPATAPTTSPSAAAAWSLVLPGLGHWFAGRKAEAVARFVLTAWIAGMLLVLVSSRVGGVGLGGAVLVVVFVVAAVALWTEAAVDGRRAAAGLAPVVSSRAMLWACVALVGLSITLSTLLAVPGLQIGAGK